MSERNEEVVPLRSTPQVQDAEKKAAMPDLACCPFCGADGEELGCCYDSGLTPAFGADWFIRCYACHVETARANTEAEAIAAWNRRSPSPDAVVSLLKRWAALDSGSWHAERHAGDKSDLLRDTRAARAALATKE